MTEKEILDKIKSLEEQEHTLYSKDGLSAEERKRAGDLRVELDRYWDLLRQKRALSEFGKNPEKADLRGADTVENYEQ